MDQYKIKKAFEYISRYGDYFHYAINWYYLKPELKFDLKIGDKVSLSLDGYIVKHGSKESDHLTNGYPYMLKEHEGYIVKCERMPFFGTFLGWYPVEEDNPYPSENDYNKINHMWIADTISIKGLIPLCVILEGFENMNYEINKILYQEGNK
jgi:hypothetical protein